MTDVMIAVLSYKLVCRESDAPQMRSTISPTVIGAATYGFPIADRLIVRRECLQARIHRCLSIDEISKPYWFLPDTSYQIVQRRQEFVFFNALLAVIFNLCFVRS